MSDVGRNSPRYRRLLGKHAAELLEFFSNEDAHRLDGALFSVANVTSWRGASLTPLLTAPWRAPAGRC
jgi:hypothetical protein